MWDDSWGIGSKVNNTPLYNLSLSLLCGANIGDRPSCRHVFTSMSSRSVGVKLNVLTLLEEGL